MLFGSGFRKASLATLICWPILLAAQDGDVALPRIRPEVSNFEETSRYQDVEDFLEAVTAVSPSLHLSRFGYSTEGRALPLVVFGDLADASPESVLKIGKTRIFAFANIHAGEVCGKEALLMLVRNLAEGKHGQWAESLILLMAPIYNADGNERISLFNRPRQHGPLAGMGERANAQGYDLNRDHMKLDSPEARALVELMNAYDPHIVIDLHTTNGTRHAYHLTYAPPLNPNTDREIDSYLRGKLLTAVTQAIREKQGWDTYYYGNLPWRSMEVERGWYTFDHRPRFNNNYVGLRNRFGILSEAYAYATFEERILASLYFVEEILNYVHGQAREIRKIAETADVQSIVGQRLALAAQFARSQEPVEILLGEVQEERHPYTGRPILRRKDVRKPEKMYEYGTFEATETEIAPARYFLAPDLRDAIELLTAHGIEFSRLETARQLTIERFRIDSTRVAEREYQGHRQRRLFGGYERAEAPLAAQTVVVPVDQPLGRLIFYLLEPRSDDGLVAWNLLDDALQEAEYYPIFRTPPE